MIDKKNANSQELEEQVVMPTDILDLYALSSCHFFPCHHTLFFLVKGIFITLLLHELSFFSVCVCV